MKKSNFLQQVVLVSIIACSSPACAQVIPIRMLQQIWEQPRFVYPNEIPYRENRIESPMTDSEVRSVAQKLNKQSRQADGSKPNLIPLQGQASQVFLPPTTGVGQVDGKAATQVQPPIAQLPDVVDLVARMKRIGMHEDSAWQASSDGPGWTAKLSCYNGADGERLSAKQARLNARPSNQISCQFIGSDSEGVAGIRLEATILDRDHAAKTLEMGGLVINAMFDHATLQSAFVQGKNMTMSNWSVRQQDHEEGDGFDVIADLRLKPEIMNPQSYLESAWHQARKVVKRKGSGAGDAAQYQTLEPPIAPSDISTHVVYLGDARFEVRDVLGNRHYTCVVGIVERDWKTYSIVWGGEVGK